MAELFWIYPLALLIALIVVFVFGDRLGEKSALVGAFASITVFFLTMTAGPAIFAQKKYTYTFEWFSGLEMGFRLDGLSWIMTMLVSLLVTMILVYAFSYMENEKGLRRFFSFMILFAFSMIQLVIADNLLQMFIAWEIMGLCSYSLIGFYFEKPSASAAGKKAFMTTRVGDVIMLAGLMVLYTATGSFKYDDIFLAASSGLIPMKEIGLATLLIFGGVVGKSAQFPLHIWLPDAMEGPTPVSALIHAAAMVKAGMYLMIRLYPLYEMSAATLNIVMIIGSITVIFAALMAVFADDFKQVLAFSTISQLGYMTVALGCLGAFPALLHVINHAFFKALLFLGAGSVIHSVGTGDINQMGGVFKSQKATGLAMFVGTLSIAGIPGLSGFISKDEILLQVYANGSIWSYYVLLFTGMITAFYMFRLFFMVFTGEQRSSFEGHESPLSMVMPLIFLAIAAIFSGQLKGMIAQIMNVTQTAPHNNLVVYSSVAMGLAGTFLAFLIYYLKVFDREKILASIGGLKTFFLNRYYMDYVIENTIKYSVMGLNKISSFFERRVVDGLVNGIASLTKELAYFANVIDVYVFDGAVRGVERTAVFKGGIFSAWNSGNIQRYLTWTVAGLLLLMIILVGGVLL